MGLIINPYNFNSFNNPLSVEYDGTNEYSTLGVASGVVSASEYTISMWVKLLARPAFDSRYWGDNGGYFYIREGILGQIQFLHFGGGSSGIQTLSVNVWTHLVLTKKTGSVSFLYKNAVISVGGNIAGATTISNQFYVGGINVAGYQVNMRTNTFEIWNRYLTQLEVTELYNNGRPTNPATTSMAANLTHNYRCGNGSDVYPTMYDYTGTKNATMVNMESSDFVTDAP